MDMRERAVLWTIARTPEGFPRHSGDGFPLLDAPVDVCCRWEEKQIEMTDDTGNRVVVDVILTVARSIPVNSIMWEGRSCDLPESGDPGIDLYEVLARDRGKDLNGRVTRYEYGLKRYKDTLPDLAT